MEIWLHWTIIKHINDVKCNKITIKHKTTAWRHRSALSWRYRHSHTQGETEGKEGGKGRDKEREEEREREIGREREWERGREKVDVLFHLSVAVFMWIGQLQRLLVRLQVFLIHQTSALFHGFHCTGCPKYWIQTHQKCIPLSDHCIWC